jgi:hypothetical protein
MSELPLMADRQVGESPSTCQAGQALSSRGGADLGWDERRDA